MITVLLIVIVAALLFGGSLVLGFLQGFFIAAAVLIGLIVTALFFEALLPYLLGLIGIVIASVAFGLHSDASKKKRAKEMCERDLQEEIEKAKRAEKLKPADTWPYT